ncbi:LysR family transcriptional regulator [Nodosilinea sp. PGN35]|uniref:LysR family transcriptional regulator n=1 Tax=Nodosilinea sp. PGN35 TaxID=3020489 RepID=UPI0023B2E277|nr:LysR family transcriptional regulator [Nodosilinea sp. TSF1-S3]MDF0366079.1 LysR family transcriptional regulator [Nodosilinea sp. TSF1-S3]
MPANRWGEIEFRHLEYAIAVKTHQGFIQAAIALDLDQGFLSRQIQRLESRLGCQLFDRTTRPLGLTAAGSDFLLRAEQIVAQTERAVGLAQAIHAGQRGRLTVGINTSIANSQLPAIVQAFSQRFPEVALQLLELASYDQIQQIEREQIDVGFFHQHNLDPLSAEDRARLTLTPILSEPLVLVLPQAHPAAQQTAVSLRSLRGDRFVLPPPTLLQGLRGQIDQLFAQAGYTPALVQEAAWITTVLSLVAGGVGLSLLPANVVNLQRVGVVYRPIQEAVPPLNLVAVSAVANRSAPLRNFLEVLDSLRGTLGN